MSVDRSSDLTSDYKPAPLPLAYKTTAFAMLSISDAKPCVCGKLALCVWWLAPVSHRMTAYKTVGHFFGLSYRKLSGSNQVINSFFYNQ